ncbi:hypothetical protein HanLR1_Chr04g0138301 [Helianthus annuus]|uniref:Uncharacterized protein n=1 Tax=Helianthus annuus TaxID=4232 RepID=A0A251VS74_HELAN|nr:hypothetical protein HanLR1_Chr04g0138301 [Helianthus annuus]
MLLFDLPHHDNAATTCYVVLHPQVKGASDGYQLRHTGVTEHANSLSYADAVIGT